MQKSGQFGGETGATERGRLLRFLAGRPGELMGAIRGADTGRLRQYPRQTRAAGSGGPSMQALMHDQPQPMCDHPDNKKAECGAADHHDRTQQAVPQA